MLAVNPVLADKVENPADLGTSHDVYVESTIDMAESGIAGVQYVNRMVGVAGAAAQKAEDHAASAGDSAYKAAGSAEDAQGAADKAADDAAKAAASAEAANEALSTKLDNAWGADKKNLAMVTDDKGSVYPGYISTDMIADKAVTAGKMSSNGAVVGNTLLVASGATGMYVYWGDVTNHSIAEGAVTEDKIAEGAVTSGKIADGAVRVSKIYGGEASKVLVTNASGKASWGQVGSGGIADGAVTTAKIASDSRPSGVLLVADGSGGAEWGLVGSSGIAEGAVTSGKIANAAVTLDKMNADGALPGHTLAVVSNSSGSYVTWGQVESDGIADGAVTAKKIADGAVTEDKMLSSGQSAGVALLADGNYGAEWGQVGTAGIADHAVTKDKIASSYINGSGNSRNVDWGMALLSDGNGGAEWGQVGRSGIADGAVTTDKIDQAAVTADKIYAMTGIESFAGLPLLMDDGKDLAWGQVESAGIADDAVTEDKIADGAVTAVKIAEGAVRSDNISGGSVTASKMSASGAIPGQVLVPKIVNGNFTTGVVWGQVGTAGIAPGAVRADNMFSSGEAAGFALLADGNAGAEWGQVGTAGIEDGAVTSGKIADGAVTREKTNGIVGVIPVGSATNPTSYGSFWIE